MRTVIPNIVVTILLMWVCSCQVHAQEKEKRLSLVGDWKFSLGDNSKFAKPEYDDSDWETIYVPSNWHQEGFRNYHGYAWYRRKFVLEYSEKDMLFLELGKIDDVDEVYLNGHFIGQTGGFPPDYFTAWNYSRRYAIPREHLNKNGKNVLSVRVYDEGGEGGIMGSDVAIYNYKNYSANSVHLFGQWKFKLGDDKRWGAENVNDSDWEEIIVPASWESQGFAHYDGFAWYRKSFNLPDNFKTNDLFLLVGKIDDLDEVYVNGRLIGSTGKIERKWSGADEYQRNRTYSVPDGLLLPGKLNVIAVRVYDQEGVGGIYEGPVTLLPKHEYKEFWKSYRNNTYNNGSSFMSWLSDYLD